MPQPVNRLLFFFLISVEIDQYCENPLTILCIAQLKLRRVGFLIVRLEKNFVESGFGVDV